MAGNNQSTLSQIPSDLSDLISLRLFLTNLVTKVDELYTFRGSESVKIEPLNLTVSNPPTQAEIQRISDKLDEIIKKSVLNT